MEETVQSPRNVSDPVQIETKDQFDKSRRLREMNDTRWVMSSPEGRRWLWEMLGYCGVSASVVRSGYDVEHVLFLAGAQDVGRHIQSEIMEANMGAYLTMQREAIKDAKADAAILRGVEDAMRRNRENSGLEDLDNGN